MFTRSKAVHYFCNDSLNFFAKLRSDFNKYYYCCFLNNPEISADNITAAYFFIGGNFL